MYAAYGMNMDPDHMSAKAPRSPIAGTGWLRGWRLTFSGGSVDGPGPHSTQGALASVVEDPGSQVFVVLYDVTEDDVALLDRWEGTDTIRPQRLRSRVHRLPNLPAGPPVDAQVSEFSVSDVTPGSEGSAGGLSDEEYAPRGEDDDVVAWFYVMDAYEGGLPLAAYLGQLADAAESAGAPPEYVHDLRTRPCQAGGAD